MWWNLCWSSLGEEINGLIFCIQKKCSIIFSVMGWNQSCQKVLANSLLCSHFNLHALLSSNELNVTNMEDKSGNENNNILGMKTCACFPKNALLKILVSYEAKNVQMSSSSFFETWVFTTPVFRTLDFSFRPRFQGFWGGLHRFWGGLHRFWGRYSEKHEKSPTRAPGTWRF